MGERDPAFGVDLLRGGAQPPTPLIVACIDAYKDQYGVQPICTTLQIAPSTY